MQVGEWPNLEGYLVTIYVNKCNGEPKERILIIHTIVASIMYCKISY